MCHSQRLGLDLRLINIVSVYGASHFSAQVLCSGKARERPMAMR